MNIDAIRLDKFAEDLILNNKSLELTPAEKKQLSILKFPKQKDSIDEDIVPVRVDSSLETPFVENFLAAQKKMGVDLRQGAL